MTGKLLFGGDKIKIKAAADEGNYVKSLSVDGTEIFTNDDASVTETVQEVTVPNIWPTVYVAPEKTLEVVPTFEVAKKKTILNFSYPWGVGISCVAGGKTATTTYDLYDYFLETSLKSVDFYLSEEDFEVLGLPSSVQVNFKEPEDEVNYIAFTLNEPLVTYITSASSGTYSIYPPDTYNTSGLSKRTSLSYVFCFMIPNLDEINMPLTTKGYSHYGASGMLCVPMFDSSSTSSLLLTKNGNIGTDTTFYVYSNYNEYNADVSRDDIVSRLKEFEEIRMVLSFT